MWAASEGHSNLGIPTEVGKEFTKSDSAGKPELGDLNDREAAEAIRDGELPSPTKFGDSWLFDLRVTGTNIAYRDSVDEWAYRDVKQWLTDDFIDRCNGLAVIFGVGFGILRHQLRGSVQRLQSVPALAHQRHAEYFPEHSGAGMSLEQRTDLPLRLAQSVLIDQRDERADVARIQTRLRHRGSGSARRRARS